jgi:hypothetical protein
MTQENMLSERQVRAIVLNVNEDVNLPFIREKQEEELITKFVNKINAQLIPAFDAVIGSMFCQCMKLALCEKLPLKERRKQICTIMRAELSQPVADALNEKVDMRGLSEGIERKVLKAIVDKIIKEFVEWTIGEIDEKVNESLRELGEPS